MSLEEQKRDHLLDCKHGHSHYTFEANLLQGNIKVSHHTRKNKALIPNQNNKSQVDKFISLNVMLKDLSLKRI
jgi:hypothetical protein